MKKSLTRTFYLIGLALVIVGMVLLFVSIPGGTSYTTASGGTNITPGNPTLFAVAIFMMIVSSVPMLIAWIGALVKMGQLQRWGWFICLLLFSGITLLVYIFAGPETPAPSAMAAQGGMPPQPYSPYQQYPQQPQYPPYPEQPQQPYQYPGQYPNTNQPPYGAPQQGQSPYGSYPPNEAPPPSPYS